MIRMSLRRPVAVTMTYTVVALLGVAAWRNIPIEMLPETDLPRLTVQGSWRGASSETVYHVLERGGARRRAGALSYSDDGGVLPKGIQVGLSPASGGD